MHREILRIALSRAADEWDKGKGYENVEAEGYHSGYGDGLIGNVSPKCCFVCRSDDLLVRGQLSSPWWIWGQGEKGFQAPQLRERGYKMSHREGDSLYLFIGNDSNGRSKVMVPPAGAKSQELISQV